MRTPILAAILLLAGGLLAAGCGGESVDPALKDAFSSGSTDTEEPFTPVARPLPAAVAEEPPAPAARPQPAAVADRRPATEVILEIVVWDDTESNPPDAYAAVVVPGFPVWLPDLTFGADKKAFGIFPVGEEHEFFVYPEGREEGKAIRVQFAMQPDMISGSDAALTHVEIHDTTIIVWGDAVQEFPSEFKR